MPAAIGELYVSNFTIPGDRQWNSVYLTSVMSTTSTYVRMKIALHCLSLIKMGKKAALLWSLKIVFIIMALN